MEEAIAIDPSDPRGYSALGGLQFSIGARDEAEQAFRRAVTEAPQSSEAHLALASYYFAVRRFEAAEQEYRRAHALAPADELTNRAVAVFYLHTDRAPAAEPYFLAAARSHDRARIALADYYMLVRRLADAEAAMTPLTTRRDYNAEVQPRLAAIRYAQGKRAEAYRIVDALLAQKRPSARAQVLKARFLMADGHADQALPLLQNAVRVQPGLVAAHFALGTVLLQRRDTDGARRAFEQVLKLNPRATIARVALAQAAFEKGDSRKALQLAQQAAEQDPDHAGAQLTYVRMLRAAGEQERADSEVAALLKREPNQAVLLIEQGAIRFERRDLRGARAAFSRASALAPNAIEPLAGLVTVDVAEGRVAEARRRVDERLAARPNDSHLLVLAGRVAASARDTASAERLLRRAVETDPSNPEACASLGQVYITAGRLDDARREFEQLARSKPVAGHTMLGLIEEAQHDTAGAIRQYEAALKADRRSALAANNLAWLRLYSGQIEDAVRLARVAQEGLPDRPEMNDTLGWTLYRAGRPHAAIPYLKHSIERAGGKALYLYHLGMAYIASGDRDEGEANLKRALAIDARFPGHEQARAALAATPSS
jgi:Flp pilus assembly protein TadD